MNNNKNRYLTKHVVNVFLAAFVVFSASSVLASSITVENIELLVNRERRARNLQPLAIDSDLSNAAYMKSKDMLNRSYFDHYAFGLTPWNFMINSGYEYIFAGENLAMDFQTSEGMVKAWMNSPAHRDNILNPEFRDLGIGIVKGEFKEGESARSTVMVTNMFGRQTPSILKFFESIKNRILNIL